MFNYRSEKELNYLLPRILEWIVTISDTSRLAEPRLKASYIYALTVLASATGAFFATHRLLFDLPLPEYAIFLAHLLIVVSLVMGYNGNSFLAAVLTGVLPWAGYYASIWVWPPFDMTRLESMVAGASVGMMWALPVASLLFILGVRLRRDGTFTEQKRLLGLRLAAVILVFIAIAYALETGLLQAGGDQ